MPRGCMEQAWQVWHEWYSPSYKCKIRRRLREFFNLLQVAISSPFSMVCILLFFLAQFSLIPPPPLPQGLSLHDALRVCHLDPTPPPLSLDGGEQGKL